jgi:hypothetical protein
VILGEFVVDNFVRVATDLAEQIYHFVCYFPSVNLDFFGVLDEILEKVGILLTIGLYINLEEI